MFNVVENLPLPSIGNEGQKKLRGLVDIILKIVQSKNWLNKSSEQAKVRNLEKQIDQMVYKLYDLTMEEIAIVEGKG